MFEGDLAGTLNRGAFGERVAERDADLEHVGAAVEDRGGKGLRRAGLGVADGDIGDERGAALGLGLGEAVGDAAHRRPVQASKSDDKVTATTTPL